MRARSLRRFIVVAFVAAIGCTRQQQPAPAATQPARGPATASAPASAPAAQAGPKLLPESEHWSRAQALAHLADDAARLSAAVRLVRLAGTKPLIVPDPLTPQLLRRLRVVRLSDAFWALGWAADDPRKLAAPVLIDKTGAVRSPLDHAEEETSVLYVSPDADLFPHLLVTPKRVLLVSDDVSVMLVGRVMAGCRFEVREKDGYWYLALVFRGRRAASQPASRPAEAEVARYEWDPYEESFTGPARDRLPDPPGGEFELDVDASEGLVPVGGDLPKPPPPPKPAPKRGEPTPF